MNDTTANRLKALELAILRDRGNNLPAENLKALADTFYVWASKESETPVHADIDFESQHDKHFQKAEPEFVEAVNKPLINLMEKNISFDYYLEIIKKNGIGGWCSPEKAKRLYDLVFETAEGTSDFIQSVELGVFYGRSLFAMAIAHRDLGLGRCYGYDAWRAQEAITGSNSSVNNEWWLKLNYKQIMEQVKADCIRFGFGNCFDDQIVQPTLFIKQVDSITASTYFKDNSVTLLHQDSSHNVETITAELEAWTPKLKMGAYWVGDDCDWVEAREGYAKLPYFGFELLEDYVQWQIWQKVGEIRQIPDSVKTEQPKQENKIVDFVNEMNG